MTMILIFQQYHESVFEFVIPGRVNIWYEFINFFTSFVTEKVLFIYIFVVMKGIVYTKDCDKTFVFPVYHYSFMYVYTFVW